MASETNVSTIDAWLWDSSGALRAMPQSVAGAVMSATLGISAVFVSAARPRSMNRPNVSVAFYGSQDANIYIEESWDDGTTWHNYSTVATAAKTLTIAGGGSAQKVATMTARILAPKYRIVVVNGGAAQVGAKLWALETSQ